MGVVLALFTSGVANPVATQVFTPAHDAYALQGSPTTVGNDAHLRARKTSSSNAHAYFKFAVTGLSGPPSAAKLRLYVTDASPSAGPVVTASNTTPAGSPWSETSLTWNTKPALGTSALSSVGAATVGAWVEYDLKSSIGGNGTYSFALTGGSSDPTWFSSAEGANPPQLVVTPGAAPGNSAPVANADSYSTTQGTPLSVSAPGVLGNDTDADGNALTAVKVTDPGHGTLSLASNGSFTYTPTSGFTGSDSFSYKANDGTADGTTATVTFAVNAGGGGGGGGGGPITLSASDDAYALQGSPTTVGNDAHLRARKTSSSSAHAYLKFAVTGLTGPPSAAKLRLYVTDASPSAGPVVTASNTTPAGSPWSEASLTWNTKPALGTSALSSVGAATVGAWVEYDLKSSIAGNGTYSFALTGGSSDPTWFSSAEGANPPQLVLTPGGPPPPPAPPAADFSASPRSGVAALTVQFSDASSGMPNKWAWDFQSDGTIDSTVQNPQFTYALPGTHDVTLQVENSLGSDVETKLDYVTVTPANVPTNTSPPLISAVASERSAFHARPGTWTGALPITYAYQWRRCDSTGAGCTDIPDATSRRYSLTVSDVGATLQVTATATNSGGSGAASSAVSGVVPARPSLPPGDPVIAAVGDIACPPNEATTLTACRQKYTADLVVDAGLTAVLVPGDIQYNNGEYENFLASYDPTWGRVNGITYPAPGNHEYGTTGATGYFQYFGSVAGDPSKGYYSVDIGTWHVVALNSNCSPIGGCGAGSAQEQWLRADLTANPATCTVAYWHHPRFSSGDHGSTGSMQALWQALYDGGADVVLSGHDHNYERFAPQTATGASDPVRGIREFVVGTGGRGLRPFRTPIANSEVRNATTFGILELTLHASGYDWQFVPEAGKTFTDSGTAACH